MTKISAQAQANLDAALTRLITQGASDARIKDALGITQKVIYTRAKKLGLKRIHREPEEIAFEERARQNVMHLVDLKRAGHSPTRTEKIIKPDPRKPTRMVHAPLTMSCVGSPMARCAEIDGPGGW